VVDVDQITIISEKNFCKIGEAGDLGLAGDLPSDLALDLLLRLRRLDFFYIF